MKTCARACECIKLLYSTLEFDVVVVVTEGSIFPLTGYTISGHFVISPSSRADAAAEQTHHDLRRHSSIYAFSTTTWKRMSIMAMRKVSVILYFL